MKAMPVVTRSRRLRWESSMRVLCEDLGDAAGAARHDLQVQLDPQGVTTLLCKVVADVYDQCTLQNAALFKTHARIEHVPRCRSRLCSCWALRCRTTRSAAAAGA